MGLFPIVWNIMCVHSQFGHAVIQMCNCLPIDKGKMKDKYCPAGQATIFVKKFNPMIKSDIPVCI